MFPWNMWKYVKPEKPEESVSRRDSSGFSTWLILSCWQFAWEPVFSGLHKHGLCIVMAHGKQTDSEVINPMQKKITMKEAQAQALIMERTLTWSCWLNFSLLIFPCELHHCDSGDSTGYTLIEKVHLRHAGMCMTQWPTSLFILVSVYLKNFPVYCSLFHVPYNILTRAE